MDFAVGSAAPAGDPGNSEVDRLVDCERCGESNAERARFCQACGSRLGDTDEDAYGWRGASGLFRIVTALACEVSPTGPAAGDELAASAPATSPSTQPQALAQIRTIVERHGGAARDLPGSTSSIAAVFGPEPPEGDGPLRALRAAAEIRTALATDGGPAWGLSVRVGVGTSEVMGEDPDAERLWRDRVVDLALRLQLMAEPGEVIVSEGTYRRVGDAAELRPVDGRTASTNQGSVGPLRLIDVTPGPLDLGLTRAPLIGRDREISLVREVFDRTVATRGCSLVRFAGGAGIGKTRLGDECLRTLGADASATTIRVRSRPRSEGGITWPLAELVARAVGLADDDGSEEARAKIERLLADGPDAARVAERLLPALGLGGRAVARETPWALRLLLEGAAREHPLVVFFDDVDRAGPGFDRLLREVAERSRDAPILLILARESEPDDGDRWPVVELDPLDPAEIGSLVAATLGDRALAHDLRDAVVRGCGGSPLMAEQLTAMLVGSGHLRLELGRWVSVGDPGAFPIPESLEALLQERVRGLGIDERAVIGLAAVVGESFPWAPIAQLVPEESREAVRDHLGSLVGAQLLRPDGEDAFEFAHGLIRDATYVEVPAEVRAEVHERYARWLETSEMAAHARSAELVGSHLTASRRAGGGGVGEDEIPRHAAGLLARAASGTRSSGDVQGALELWRRAADLLPPEDEYLPELLLEAGRAEARLDDQPAADALLTHAGRLARTIGNPVVEWRAKLLRMTLRAGSADADTLELVREVADSTIQACTELGDDLGLAWAWTGRAAVHRRRGYWAAAADAAERAAEHARIAGHRDEEVAALRDLAGAISGGRVPVSESIERCERVLERVRGERPEEQEVAALLAILLARRGSFGEARDLVALAASELEGLGMDREEAACLLASARIEAMAGQPEEAEQALRRVADMADRVGDREILSQVAAALARVFLDRGRAQEALELTEATEPPTWDDVATQVEWRAVRARALAAAGGHEEANILARQAVKLADQTDLVELRSGALLDLADVLLQAGRPNEAMPFARRALRALQRKGVEGAAERARAVIEQVEGVDTRRETPDDLAPSEEVLEGAANPEEEAPVPETLHEVVSPALEEVRDSEAAVLDGTAEPPDPTAELPDPTAEPPDPTSELPVEAPVPVGKRAKKGSSPEKKSRWGF